MVRAIGVSGGGYQPLFNHLRYPQRGASAIVLYRTSTSHTSSVAFVNETTLAGMVRLASNYLLSWAMVKLVPHLSAPYDALFLEAKFFWKPKLPNSVCVLYTHFCVCQYFFQTF